MIARQTAQTREIPLDYLASLKIPIDHIAPCQQIVRAPMFSSHCNDDFLFVTCVGNFVVFKVVQASWPSKASLDRSTVTTFSSDIHRPSISQRLERHKHHAYISPASCPLRTAYTGFSCRPESLKRTLKEYIQGKTSIEDIGCLAEVILCLLKKRDWAALARGLGFVASAAGFEA